MSPAIRTPGPTLAGPTAVPATALMFWYNGLVIGAWAASLAGLRERLHLDAAGVSVLLILVGTAAITGMQAGGRLADSRGARRVILTAFVLLTIGVTLMGVAPRYDVLLLAGGLIGLGNGALDVAMNALGVQVERHRTRPVMSFLHGLWSVGNLAGAGLLLLFALTFPDRAAWLAASLVGLMGAGATVLLARVTPESEVVPRRAAGGEKVKVPRWAWLLGLMAVGFGLGEGTAMDWSGIHVTDVAGVPAAQGSLAVSVVAAFMVLIRLIGDRLVARYGRRAVVRFGGGCAAAGYLVVATVTPLPAVLSGWALVGFGIGMIAPQVYAVAGHAGGGRVLAVVVTFGYAMFLIGPAVIGFFVDLVGVQRAMLVPAVLLLALPFLAAVMPREGDLRHA